jgi:hypothetical protein
VFLEIVWLRGFGMDDTLFPAGQPLPMKRAKVNRAKAFLFPVNGEIGK